MDLREGFVFYRSFWECISELDADTQSKVLKALCEYALDGIEPTGSGIISAIFRLMKPQVDANVKRYENGKKGGRPKTETEPYETKANQTITKANQTEPNDNQDEPKDKVKDKVKVKDKEKVNQRENRLAPFRPPTLEEVKEYCEERGNHVDAQRFIDFYSAKGWMVGKNKMKDWKAAIRTWESGDKERGPTKPTGWRYDGRQRSTDEFSSIEADLLRKSQMYAEGGTI